MLDYAAARNRDFPDVVQHYTQRDTMLYALGLGYGGNPLDEDELRFVFEADLACVPSQAAVLGSPGFFWQDPRLGVDWVKIVHGEQDIRCFKPLPPAATIIGRNRIAALTDKGPGKGVIAQVVDASRLRRLAARFTAPVFPGETLTFDLWRRDETEIAVRARVAARDVIVLNHGVGGVAPGA